MADDTWQPPLRKYGKIADLPERVAYWIGRTSTDKSLPWVGLGLIADLECLMRLLTLKEFGEWCATHPDDEIQQWGAEIIDAAAARGELVELTAVVERNLPASGVDYPTDVTQAGKSLADVRAVLVEAGALSADDTDTALPDLIRALLS